MTNEAECPVRFCDGIVRGEGRDIRCDGPEAHDLEAITEHFGEGFDPQTDDDEYDFRYGHHRWRMNRIDEASYAGEGDICPPSKNDLIRPPSWPTGMVGTADHCRSFRGVTILSGKASSGKTACAVPSSLMAAQGEWNVLYIAAEGPAVVHQRMLQFCKAERWDGPPAHWRLVHTNGHLTLDRLKDAVKKHAVTPRSLIVIDSINSMVDAMPGSDEHGIGHIRALALWMMNVRARTRGEVSFMILSEANASGETKGRVGDHKADLSVNFQKLESDYSVKRVNVVKSWWTDCGMVGDFNYDPDTAVLRHIVDLNGEQEDDD